MKVRWQSQVLIKQIELCAVAFLQLRCFFLLLVNVYIHSRGPASFTVLSRRDVNELFEQKVAASYLTLLAHAVGVSHDDNRT